MSNWDRCDDHHLEYANAENERNCPACVAEEIAKDLVSGITSLCGVFAALISVNKLRENLEEDTIGVLNRCRAFHYLHEKELVALAKAIDASEVKC